MQADLRQRGRALMDFEVTIRKHAARLHADVERHLADIGIEADTLPESLEARHSLIESALSDNKLYGTRRLVSEACARNMGVSALEAFEEIRDEAVPRLDALSEGASQVEIDPEFRAPDYHANVWFHRTHGGWDGSEYQGFVHGEIVHRNYVAKIFPGDIFAERGRALESSPVDTPRRILEIGTSSGYATLALARRYPDAEITGIDPSRRMLEQACRIANEHGFAWRLIVGLGEDTGLTAESFDLVVAYNVHHELPLAISSAIMTETMRVLAPGGGFLFADAPRTGAHDRMKAWSIDWTARWFGEPYWREACADDIATRATDTGFVDVGSHELMPAKTYVTWGRKPS